MNIKEKIKEHLGLIIFAVIATLIVVIIVGSVVLQHTSRHFDTITVSEKTVKRSGYGENTVEKYLIFSTDGRVYENTDSLIEGKFNSSNVYGMLVPGNTYKIESYGYRLPYYSMYPNIVNVKEIAKKVPKKTNPVVLKESDILGGPDKETFIDIDGKRAFLKIDGLPVDTYVKQLMSSGYTLSFC